MKKGSVLREIAEWLAYVLTAVILTLLIINYVGQITIVKGDSMLPTIKDQSILVIEKLSRYFGNLKQGDIVILKIPELLGNEKTYAIKRLIAQEGQKITIRDGSVYVDGEKLDEPYINGTQTMATAGVFDELTIPEGYVYVLGDNRLPGRSRDSRTFGPIGADRIEGRVLFK